MKFKFTMTDAKLTRRSKESIMRLDYGTCDACGAWSHFTYKPVIDKDLARQWRMSKAQREAMSARESMNCLFCGSSYRLRLLARAINYIASGNAYCSLEENIIEGKLNQLKLAEINSCGVLHEILRKIPNCSYSEYVPSDSTIQQQDIERLTYKSEIFDAVLTSDVLEHVPDVQQALRETFRVLKPGGVHIMTIPLLMDRKTKVRATQQGDGSPLYIAEPSYHGAGQSDYLVWSEFGVDFIDECREAGFSAHHLFLNQDNETDFSGVIVAIKPGVGSNLVTKLPKRDHIKDSKYEWSDRKLAELAEKFELTENHISNLQKILDAHVLDNHKKAEYIQQLESRGLRYHLRKKINETGRRRGRQ